MNEYDRGWKECASFICSLLEARAKGWRVFNNTLTDSIADEYDITIRYILEKYVEDNKQVQPSADIG
jgi:hypothetical protein